MPRSISVIAAAIVCLLPTPVRAEVAAAVPAATIAPTAPAATTTPTAPPKLEEIHRWNEIGLWREAEEGARSLLVQAERTSGPDSVHVAEVLDELAVALRRRGRGLQPEIMEVCARALRIKERAFGRKDPRFATSQYNLGILYYVRKDYARAIEILDETLDTQEAALGGNDPRIAKTLLTLGAIYSDLGENERAQPLVERAVGIEEAALGRTNPERAMGLNTLAVLRYRVGDYSGAIPLFEEAIRLWEQSPAPNQGVIATCNHNLAGIYAEVGDHPRAIELYERALRIRDSEPGELNPYTPSTLTGLGAELLQVGEIPRAKEAFQRAVRLLRTANPADPDVGWALMNLGWAQLAEGDPRGATTTFEEALRNQEAALGPDNANLWMTLRGLAMAARRRGETEAARGYYERAAALVRKTEGPRHPDLGRTLAEYASFQLAAGDSLAALDTALEAAAINREHLRLTLRGLPEREALIYAAGVDTGIDVAFDAVSGAAGSRSADSIRRAWDALVRSRAQVLDELGERARLVEGAGGFLETARRLEEARGRLAALLVQSSSTDDREQGSAHVAEARAKVEAAERELAAHSASFRAGTERSTIGIEQVLQALPPRAAIVSYACYGEARRRSYIAFVAGIDRKPKVVRLGSSDEVDRGVERWRRLAGVPPAGGPAEVARAEAACRREGEALRAKVWDPVAPLLAGAGLVLVVPDGPLHLLSFAALPAPEGGYLVESSPVLHYVSAERDIAAAAPVRSHGTGLLAVGNASFDRPEAPLSQKSDVVATAKQPDASLPVDLTYRRALASNEDFRSVRFTSLPETDREVDEVRKLWGRPAEVVVLEGERAGERAVKELLPGKRVAHFATHGFFLGPRANDAGGARNSGTRGIGGIAAADAPKVVSRGGANPFHLSGLAFAGANLRAAAKPGEQDGILVAEEIASLNLSGLDWVVLSACDTGLGDVRSGEGVLGIRRAFQIAGAGTLIMSLWEVGDRDTREWMTDLYDGRIRRSLETAEAVREADLTMLRSLRTQGRSTHPFYWAPFVAAGDWR